MRGCFEREREHLGIGRRGVGAPEGFDAGLQEFGGLTAAMTEYRPEVAEACNLAGRGRGKVVARNRDGQIGAQAIFAAVRRSGEIHALADILAREVEERLRRLQHGGRSADVAGALIGGDQRLRPRVGCFRLPGHACVHRDSAVPRRVPRSAAL